VTSRSDPECDTLSRRWSRELAVAHFPEAVGGQRWPAPPRGNRNQRRCGNRSDGCERLFACPSGVL